MSGPSLLSLEAQRVSWQKCGYFVAMSLCGRPKERKKPVKGRSRIRRRVKGKLRLTIIG